MSIDRRKALVLLSVIAMAAIMSGIVINAYSASNGVDSSGNSAEWFNATMMRETFGSRGGPMHGHGCGEFIEVSEEFEENVTKMSRTCSMMVITSLE
jgi:hypothetical protein